MARFKPQIHIDNEYHIFDTYQELKQNLKSLIKKSESKIAFVYRSRRGEWGEWFEHWKLNHIGKPTIIKQGWS